MNRTDWQRLADERERDALALLAAGQWSGAYYLAGYAVECGLKSCILVRLQGLPELIFLEKRFSEKCWTHDLEELVVLADLTIVRAAEARAIVSAITDTTNGVLPWIRTHW